MHLKLHTEAGTNHDSEFSASLAAASVAFGQLQKVSFKFASSDLTDTNGVRAFQ